MGRPTTEPRAAMDRPDASVTENSAGRTGDPEAARIAARIAEGGSDDPFVAAVRATCMPMTITDPRLPDNPVVFANDAFCGLTGYPRDEIVGRNCRFLQGPETDRDTVGRVRAAVEAALPIEVDLRNHRKDGTPFWNRLMLAPVHDHAGELAYFFASQVDITIERERLESLESANAALMAEVAGRLHAQQESEARLRFAAQAGGMGFWELELASEEFAASATCKRIYGRDPAARFTYADLRAAVHPDDRDRMQDAMRQAIDTGADLEVNYRVVTDGDAVRWVEVRAQVVRAADGTALRMAGISLDATRRREAEFRLRLSEASLRLATDAAEVGAWDLDLSTDVLTWSDRTKAMFGISPGAPCNMADFYGGLHPDDLAATSAAFAAAVDPARRATYDVEYRTIGKEDGAIRWVAAKGRGLFDADRCVRALGTAIDITERRRAGARQAFLLRLWDALRSLAHPREIMDAAVHALGRHMAAGWVAYARVDEEDGAVTLEAGYCNASEPPVAGTFPLDHIGAADLARQRAGETLVIEDTADAGEAWAFLDLRSCVSVPLVRDGRLTAMLFVGDPGARRWPAEDVALIEDVAARTWDALERSMAEDRLRRANEGLEREVAERTATLRANEARLRAIFETSYQLQALLDPNGVLLDANATSLAAIDARPDEVIGKPFRDTPWFTRTHGVPAIIERAVADAAHGRATRREISVDVAAGARIYDLSMRPIGDPSGAVVGIVSEAVDVTDARLAEEALRQAQKMEAVGQLTGGIAHDFNNLLTGIMGSLEVIQRRVAAGRPADLDRYVTAAMSSAQRAGALTQRLLAFARRQPLDPRRVEANRLVSGMDDLLRRTLGPSVTLEMVLAGGLWPTLCDPNQLEGAILNLAINARDAMPDGGRLTLETCNASLDDAYVRSQGDVRAGQYVAISVTDTGTGMTPEVIAKAFDPFFTTKPTGQGTGLGLSMLYGFVKQSEGHVRIYSEVGRGTTFKLYLPRHRGRGPEEGDAGDAGDDPRPVAEAGETVLVVDDDATVRMLVVETLKELGYAALEAHDGAEALRILRSGARVDLLVTDVGLPGLNGRQVADAARVTRPALRILFITGYAHNAAVGNGDELAPGMEILSKPFALDALARKMRAMIEGA